ncbi:MAG: hypothetical protein GXN99_03305, partial [Candidatus Nanohaloarchaeota archaeon]|nr:hypothetical protein [Candidatus Nanohaloarchaeota archaeon]
MNSGLKYGLSAFMEEHKKHYNSDFDYNKLHPFLKEALLDFFDGRGWISHSFLELFHSLSSLPRGNELGENAFVEDLAVVLKALPKYENVTLDDVEEITGVLYALTVYTKSNLLGNKSYVDDDKVIRGYLSEIFSFETGNLKEGHFSENLVFYLKNADLLGSAIVNSR